MVYENIPFFDILILGDDKCQEYQKNYKNLKKY